MSAKARTLLLLILLAGPSASLASAQGCQPFQVLVFSKTAGFRHDAQIMAGVSLIQSLGATHGFTVTHTEDATVFAPAQLAGYAAVVFLHTTGDVLSSAQEAALEAWILGGGGFAGVHSAADTEYAWPFYGALVGAWFLNHPAIQSATLSVVDPSHPSTAALPATFTHTDEWYNFQSNVAASPWVNVLLTVDESTYAGGSMGAVHPIAWCQEIPGAGRSWYTGLGHTLGTYAAPFFRDHLLGGILWAAGATRTRTICGGQSYGAPSGNRPLALSGSSLAPGLGLLTVTGGSAAGAGFLCISRCPASTSIGGLTVLVDPTSILLCLGFTFDGAGTWSLPVPLSLPLPGTAGPSLHLQAAESAPGSALSNGLMLQLCP